MERKQRAFFRLMIVVTLAVSLLPSTAPALPAVAAQAATPTTYYTSEVMAKPGQAGLTGIDSSVSINDSGSVAFVGFLADGQGIFVSDSASSGPRNIAPGSVRSTVSFNPAAQINNENQVVARTHVAAAEGVPARDFLRVWDGKPGASDSFTTIVSGGVASDPFSSIANFASINNTYGEDNGGVAFRALQQSGASVLATVSNTNQLSTTAQPLPFRPQIADTGQVVVRPGTQPSQPVLLYSPDLASSEVIANAATGFTVLGRNPGISDDGSTVVFAGDRGRGPGIFASINDGSSSRKLVAIAGEAWDVVAGCRRAELGTDDAGTPLCFSSFEIDSRVAVSHVAAGRTVGTGDSLVVTFIASPSGTSAAVSDAFTSNRGIWTVRVDVQDLLHDDPLSPPGQRQDIKYDRAHPVAQIDKEIQGARITNLAVHDPIANLDSMPAVRGAHRVAYWAATTAGDMVVQATHVSSGADLSVTMIDLPDPVLVNGELTYTVEVRNNGPMEATGVTVAESLPEGIDFVSASASQGSCSPMVPPLPPDRKVNCAIGSLASSTPGNIATITIVVKPLKAVTITSTAVVTGNEPDPNTAENTTSANSVTRKTAVKTAPALLAETVASFRSTPFLQPVPYLWGGKGYDWSSRAFVSPIEIGIGYHYNPDLPDLVGRGVDCSGLILWAYNLAHGATSFGSGTNPVQYQSADGQWLFNTLPIQESELQSGDVLVFDRGRRITDAQGNFVRYEGLPDGIIDHIAMYVGQRFGDDPVLGQPPPEEDVVEAAGASIGIVWSKKDNLKVQPSFVGFARITDPRIANWSATTHSPIYLAVTDPDGYTIDHTTIIDTETERLREVPRVLYYSENGMGNDGRPEDKVVAPSLKSGAYLIKVVPKPGAQPTDTYGLEVTAGGKTITLAQNALVRDIPPQGYGIRSMGGEITQFDPEFDPDGTPPTTTDSISPIVSASGWNNTDVTVQLDAVDNSGGSGVKEISYALSGAQQGSGVLPGGSGAVIITAEGITTLTYFARDNAGNQEPAKTLTIRIDKTAPTLTFGTPSPPPNTGGTYTTDVSIPFTAADALSGVAFTLPASSPLVLTMEGEAVTGTVTVTDKAGNSATFTSPPVKINKTLGPPPDDVVPPTTTVASSPGPNGQGWNNSEVTVLLTATDEPGGSGVKEIGYTLSGAQQDDGVVPSDSATVTITAEGITTLTWFARDNAGNQRPGIKQTIRIDETPPTLRFGPRSPSPNGAGWYNTNVSIPFIATDTPSGVLFTDPARSPLVLTEEGEGVTGTITVTDRAGNSATFTSSPVDIDNAPPISITLGFTSQPSAQGWRYEGDDAEGSAFNRGGGVLHQTTASLGGGYGYSFPDMIDPMLPFTVTVRARLLAYQQSNQNPWGFTLLVTNGPDEFQVGISPFRIAGSGDTTFSTSLDTSVFHDYRMEGTPGHGFDLYIDDTFVGHAPALPATGPNRFFFGDGTAGAGADVDITSYTFTQAPGPPVAAADHYEVVQGTTLTIAAPGVLANDANPSGDALIALPVSNPAHGTLVLNDDGSFTYTPGDGFTGTDSFTYRASDDRAESVPATVTITVNPRPPLVLHLATDKGVYGPGESIAITGTVTAGGAPVANASVQARYVAPDGVDQLVTLTNNGGGNIYRGTLAPRAVQGNATVYLTARAPDGRAAADSAGVVVTGHTLTFAGSQQFPSTVHRGQTGTVTVTVRNNAYVAEATTLELADVISGGQVTLVSVDVSVPPRTQTAYQLSFPAEVLTVGSHTLRAAITRLPAGQAPDAVTTLTAALAVAEARPQLSVGPLQPMLAVPVGGSAGQVITVANRGPASILTGITVRLVSRSGGAPYPWVRLGATALGPLGHNASDTFAVTATPPAGTVPNAYQDTAIQIDTANGGSLQLPLTVYVDSARHARVLFAVHNDAGQAVAGAQVRLVSTVPPFTTRSATTDGTGVARFDGVSVGIPHTYEVSAAGHTGTTGSVTAQDESDQTVLVELAVRPIQTTWTVVPTTIVDVYDINLTLTYAVDTPVPQLAVDPTTLIYTPDPLDPGGPMLLNGDTATSGTLRVYNPSRIAVSNVVVDASGVQGVGVTLVYGSSRGARITIPSIPPLSNVAVAYETSARCPAGTLNSQIVVSGEYTYFKAAPTLSLSENDWTVSFPAGGSAARDLQLSNTGNNVATNVAVSAPSRPWVTVPRALGSLGLGNGAPFRVVVAPPAGTAAGTYTEDLVVTAGNGTPESHLRLTIVVNPDGGGRVDGVYTPGTVPPSTGMTQSQVPVRVYGCAAPVKLPELVIGKVEPDDDGGIAINFVFLGDPVDVALDDAVILPPAIVPPPPPVRTEHEIVTLAIPQRASLERQAFVATLETTDTAGADLDNFQVTLRVTDLAGQEANASGQRYVDLFAITAPDESGYGPGHAIPNGQTARSAWTLIPAPGLGGTDPAGTRYRVAATYTYTLAGTARSVTTAPVEITIYPMPQLTIDYYVPRDVKAGQPVKLGVVVRNVGAGPAKNLTIVSGQPRITGNQSGLLINFALLGSSVKGAAVPSTGLTLDFGDLPAGGQAWGYWVLATDMDGQFTGFTATYSQRDFRGVALSPLIVAVHTNIIVQGNAVPAGGQALQVVAPGEGVDPAVLLDLETGVATTLQTVHVADATLATPGQPTTRYCLAPTGGWVLAIVPDALPDTPLGAVRATRPDGTVAELYGDGNLVWRGHDALGDQVYVLDRPTGPACAPYAIRYGAASAPTVNAGGPYGAPEGGTVTLAATGSVENGGALTYAWDLDGDGTFETPGQTVAFSAAGLDGPSSRVVAVQATDAGGLTATAQVTITVTNVAPAPAIAGAPAGGTAGTTISLTAAATDPGQADTTAGFTYAWSTTRDGVAFASGTGSSFSFTPAGVGSYVVTLTATDKDGDSGTATATVAVTTASVIVTADDQSRPYGADNPPLTFTVGGLPAAGSLAVPPTCSTAATPASPVGTYPITCAGGDAGPDYTITYVAGTLTIGQAALTVRADEATRAYGDPDPPFTFSTTGLASGDSPASLGIACTAATTPASPVGTYPITCAGQPSDYRVTFVPGTLTVARANLTVTANDASRGYGQPDPPFTGTLVGVVNGDAITATYRSSADAASPPGTYPIVPSLDDPGGALGNYAVTSVNGTLTITSAGATTTVVVNATATYSDAGVVLRATVTAAMEVTEGTVTFVVVDGATTLGTVSGAVADGTATATFPLTGIGAGSYTIRANYAGAALLPSQGSGVLTVHKAATELTLTSAATLALDAQGRVTVSARLTWHNGTEPLSGKAVTFGAGGVTATATTDANGVARATLALPSDQHALTARFAGDANLLPSQAATQTIIAYQVTQFVIWGGNAGGLAVGQSCQFWGAQWAKQVTGGDFQANNSFKGYADILSADGKTWTASPGGSGNAPVAVGRYILVIVSEHASKDGSTIRGTVDGHAIVRVDAPQDYRPDPGRAGTGTIVAKLP